MDEEESEYFRNIGMASESPSVELAALELYPNPSDPELADFYRSICRGDSSECEIALRDQASFVSDTRAQIVVQQRVTIAGVTNSHRIDILQATPLHVAAAVTDAATVRCLIAHGAAPDTRFAKFNARVNKANDSTNVDVEITGGTALHISVLLDCYHCVRELSLPDIYRQRVRASLSVLKLTPVEEIVNFLDTPLESMSVDSQFDLSGASPLQLAALLSGKAMIRQSLLKFLQFRTMQISVLKQEQPFREFNHQQRFATDEVAVLDEIEEGYALHLALSMRCPESVESLLEFEDLYEIFIDAIFHRLQLVRQMLNDPQVARASAYSVERINEYLSLPNTPEFNNLWFNVVVPAVSEVWNEMVEDTSFDLNRLKESMELSPTENIAQHREALKQFAESLTVLKSPVVINQIQEEDNVLRQIGFFLLRLNCPDQRYLEGGNERRPLDYPVLTGDIATTKALLHHGAKATYIQNLWKMKDNEIVRAMMSQPHWEEYFMDRANPCRIFDSEPELAIAMMDNLVQIKKTSIDDQFGCLFEKVILNYKFFDSEIKHPRKEGVPHPILTIVRRNMTDMLQHPLVYRFIHRVFPAVFLLYFLLFLAYFVFNILFTGHLINVSIIKEQQNSEDFIRCTNSNTLSLHDMEYYRSNHFWTIGVLPYIQAFVIFFLIKEALQLVVRKLDYFGPGNMVDLFVFVSIICLEHNHGDSSGCQFYTDTQWQLAAVVLFFTWFNVFLYFRKFPVLGVYVVMFLEVLRSSVKFLILFSVLVLAFAAQYHILLGNQDRFRTFVDSCLKVFVMGVGELTYEELFLDDQSSASTLVAYDTLSRLIFVIFIIIIGIVTMNLLVGLAVDDISNIQQKAQLKRLALQADLSISILARLYEFKRKFQNHLNWWRSDKRTRRELFIASLLVIIFSSILLPVLTVFLMFTALLLVLKLFRFFQTKREEYFRIYTQHYSQKWFAVLFFGLINAVLSVQSEDEFREQVAAMKQRQKSFNYYPEDSDSSDEEETQEQLRQLQCDVARVENKIDSLLSAGGGGGGGGHPRFSRQISAAAPHPPPQPAASASGGGGVASTTAFTAVAPVIGRWLGDRGQHALLNLMADGRPASTKQILDLAASSEETEAPFQRFRRVTMRQRRQLDAKRRRRMSEESDLISYTMVEHGDETKTSSKVEVHLLPKSRTLGKE